MRRFVSMKLIIFLWNRVNSGRRFICITLPGVSPSGAAMLPGAEAEEVPAPQRV